MDQINGPVYGRLDGEPEQYREIRSKLHAAEMQLRDQRERVAALRRTLPLDTPVEDYVFDEGPADLHLASPIRQVRLSELASAVRPVVIYQFMYGKAQKKPCPMCSMWIDGFCGIARHLRQTMTFVVVAAAPIGQLRSWGAKRGWDGLRLLSCANSTFKRDIHFEDSEGRQMPGVSVFAQDAEKTLRHYYSVSAVMGEGEYRGIDLLTPVWNLLDLTLAGRGSWMPSLEYDHSEFAKE